MQIMASHETTADEIRGSREQNFVTSIIRRCQQDKGLAARLRRADNPATEYQSWDLLAGYGIDLEYEQQRLPFAAIAAAIARAKVERDGSMNLGHAIAKCYDSGAQSEQAKFRLRRLLACDDIPEVCRILRPLLSLIDSKTGKPLNYSRLLKQLHHFSFNPQRVKAQWAQEFYSLHADSESEVSA